MATAFTWGWRASLGQPRMMAARTRRPAGEGDFFSIGQINLRNTSGLTKAPISSADLVHCGGGGGTAGGAAWANAAARQAVLCREHGDRRPPEPPWERLAGGPRPGGLPSPVSQLPAADTRCRVLGAEVGLWTRHWVGLGRQGAWKHPPPGTQFHVYTTLKVTGYGAKSRLRVAGAGRGAGVLGVTEALRASAWRWPHAARGCRDPQAREGRLTLLTTAASSSAQARSSVRSRTSRCCVMWSSAWSSSTASSCADFTRVPATQSVMS